MSYRGRTRQLYNEYGQYLNGAMADMAVPLMVSSRGYGVFVDNTYPQVWSFTGPTQWTVTAYGGELNYYFIAGGTPAGVLDAYTQMTGRAPVPPRWALGYIQSKYGYTSWSQVFSVRDGFRTNDLPCDAIALDIYWFGQQMGALTWDPVNFPNAASNLTTLAMTGIKVMNIHEEYLASYTANYSEAESLQYLVHSDPALTIASTICDWWGCGGYVDFLNPSARAWFFGKLQPIINDGVAAHWTDLGEPEADNLGDYLFGGHSEFEIHNVYNLLWHQALAEGYAAHYPNQRLYILSRSGFAGDQRFGAAHWTSDTAANFATLAAHPDALCNYGMSGLSYFGSDIGGFEGLPTDELYIRWFQFGAFCPVFRAHGDHKPVAPYEFDQQVEDDCRLMLKLRYRLLPYIYTVARETFDTGMPMCRALPLVYPDDLNGQTNGYEFLFGPNLLVAPVTTLGATNLNFYLPAGTWIENWSGRVVTGPQTITKWPAPLYQIPLFYRDNSITPLGPYVASSQFDDGNQRGVRIYCDSSASYTLYDDDGISNGYLNGQSSTTAINASVSNNLVTVTIGGAVGTYAGQPSQRTWGIELFCTNAVCCVVADGVVLNQLPDTDAVATNTGWCLDGAEHLLRIKLPSAPIGQPHVVQALLEPSVLPPFEARIKAVARPYLDQSGATWSADQPYVPGAFGFVSGNARMSTSTITGTADIPLYQSERTGPDFSYRFDVPNGNYEIKLLDAETEDYNVGDRLMNVSINEQMVLSNFDMLATAGARNSALSLTFTNAVTSGQLVIEFTGVAGHTDPNARVSAISVRQITDTPPSLTCSAPPVLQCGTTATVSSEATAADGGALTLLWTVNGIVVQTNQLPATCPPTAMNVDYSAILPLGTNIVQVTATDSEGNTASSSAPVVVVDMTPPVFSSAYAQPDVLWPPNHQMVDVQVNAVAGDACGIATWKIVGVTCNEAENGKGDGNTSADWQIVNDRTVSLRAERSGTGNGRIYSITLQAAGQSGNTSEQVVKVFVPHDQGK